MTTPVDVQAQVSQYMKLLSQGMQAKDAFAQAFPNGIPTAQQKAVAQAASQQKSQYGQVGGMLAGALGAKYLVSQMTGKGGSLFGGSTGTTAGGTTAGTTGTTATTETTGSGGGLSSLFGGGGGGATTEAPTYFGPAGGPGGAGAETAPGALGSSWTEAPGTFGQAAGAAGGLYGTYNAVNDWQHGGSGRTGLTEAGGGFGSMVAGPVGGAVGAIGGNILGYGLQGTGWKNDLALAAVAPPLLMARLAGFSPIHETTMQAQQNKWLDIAKNASDPTTQAYANNYVNYIGSEQAKQDAKKDLQGMMDNGTLKGTDVWGGAGLFNTFGSDWLNHYSADQRAKISQGLIDNGLIGFHKGDVTVSDADRAKQIAAQIAPVPGTQTAQAAGVSRGNQPYKPKTDYPSAVLQQNAGFGNQLINALSKQ